uniref:Uncharacterized protein n=1 Tax=Chenopodium quinoa TaxID=63459 RepID=A0A803NBY1_CHEQI
MTIEIGGRIDQSRAAMVDFGRFKGKRRPPDTRCPPPTSAKTLSACCISHRARKLRALINKEPRILILAIWRALNLKEYVENGKLRAECKFYPKTFAADGNLNGSKNVKNHAESCLGNHVNIEKEKGKEKQTKLYFDQEHESGELKRGSRIINLNDVRETLIHMIIVDELPFKHVEKSGFRHFVQVACPQFHIPSRVTIARDCLKLYYSEKVKLREMFKTCQRIYVTTDTWTSIQRIN